jgi:hypothetical protein
MRKLAALALGSALLSSAPASASIANASTANGALARSSHAVIRQASHRSARTGPAQAWQIIGPTGQDEAGQPMAAGRVQDLAVDPFNRNHLLALADSGLWGSGNGGRTWQSLPGLNRFGQWNFERGSLAFDPRVRGVVLIASPTDNRTHTEIGIYRSTDGGQFWQSAIGFQAHCADGSVGSPSVVMFAGRRAYAAAQCEVGVSTDHGLHWSWSAPDSGGGFSGVTVDTNGTPFACGFDGVFMLFKGIWQEVMDFHSPGWKWGTPVSDCSIAASPDEPAHVFFAARWSGVAFDCGNGCSEPGSDIFEAYLANTGWEAHDLRGSAFANGRDVFVVTRPSPGGGFDLFWQNTDLLEYQHCTPVTLEMECTSGSSGIQGQPNPPWNVLGFSNPPGLHADPTRVIFQSAPPYCIRFISGDGGIQKPDPGNCNGTTAAWSYTDVGIDATESYGIALTSIRGTARPPDLYAATQDNGAYVLLSGHRWTHVDPGNDGLAIVATPLIAASQLGSVRTFYNSDGNTNIGGRGLAGYGPPPPGNAIVTAPCTGLAPLSQHQLAQVRNVRLVMLCVHTDGSSSVYSSPLTGSQWTAVAGTSVTARGDGLPGETLFTTEPTPATTGYVIQDNGNLWTISQSRRPRQQLIGWNVGSVAVSHNGADLITFACPPFPATCEQAQIRASFTGGISWRTLGAALDLATTDSSGHAYKLLADGFAPQVAAVSIDSFNSRLWAIGTLDTGLLVSSDSGRSWQRSLRVPNINSIRFDQRSRIYVGTYGRGLYGGIEPKPDQMTVTATPGKILSNHRQSFRWTATARTFSGAALSGKIIRFILINRANGHRTEAGLRATNASGRASLSGAVAPGHYLIEAIWQPRDGADLETQTQFRAR